MPNMMYAKKNKGKDGKWRYTFKLNGKTFTGGPFDDEETASLLGQAKRLDEIDRLTRIRGYGLLRNGESIDQGEVDISNRKRFFSGE